VTGLVTNPAATGYMLTHTGTNDIEAYSAGGYWNALRSDRLVSSTRSCRGRFTAATRRRNSRNCP